MLYRSILVALCMTPALMSMQHTDESPDPPSANSAVRQALAEGEQIRQDARERAIRLLATGDAVEAILAMHRAQRLGADVEDLSEALADVQDAAVRGTETRVRSLTASRQFNEADELLASVQAVFEDARLRRLHDKVLLDINAESVTDPSSRSRLSRLQTDLDSEVRSRRQLEDRVRLDEEQTRSLANELERIRRELDNDGRAETVIDTLRRRIDDQERELRRLEREIQRLERQVQRPR